MKSLISSKKIVRTLAAASALLFVSFASAEAPGMRAQIPFPFLVGNDVLPAGEYIVRANQETHRLWIQSRDHEAMALLLVIPRFRAEKLTGMGQLTFNVYGNARVLKAVWMAGETLGSELPRGKAEREMAKTAGSRPVEVAVAGWSK